MSGKWEEDPGAGESDLNSDEESGHSQIQELLDAGYEQLDGFVSWLEGSLGLDTRTAQQDCFNAESLLDYLANQHRKAALDINEYELRWFVFSHYIRKSIADRETEERLPDSLMRFFLYLRARYGMDLPEWIAAALEDHTFYVKRLKAYAELEKEDEAQWKEAFRAWCEEIEEDLDLRSLWLPGDMGEGMEWSDTMGWREATLRDEANMLWQDERSELLMNGLDFDSVRDRLISSYHLWLDTPQSRLDGSTPRETVLEERREQALLQEENVDDTSEDER